MKYFALALLLISSFTTFAQPHQGKSKSVVITDTVITTTDTAKCIVVCWTSEGGLPYLTRIPGYLITKMQKGRYMASQPEYSWLDSKLQAIKPEEVEPQLCRKANW